MLLESSMCALSGTSCPLVKEIQVHSFPLTPQGVPPCHLLWVFRASSPQVTCAKVRKIVLYAILWDVVHSQQEPRMSGGSLNNPDTKGVMSVFSMSVKATESRKLWHMGLGLKLRPLFLQVQHMTPRQCFSPPHTHITSQCGLFSVSVNNTGPVSLEEVWPLKSPSQNHAGWRYQILLQALAKRAVF